MATKKTVKSNPTKKKATRKKSVKKQAVNKKVVKKKTAAKTTAKNKKADNSKAQNKAVAISDNEKRMMIAMRAYYKWEKAGFPHGEDYKHWIEAEEEIEAMLK